MRRFTGHVKGKSSERQADRRLTLQKAQGITRLMLIYKIFRPHEWADMQTAGKTTGAPVDVADGYVHFSTAEQASETAAKHFAGESDLVLLSVETDTLGDDVRWEVSRGGALFPHLYREFRMEDVVQSWPLPLEDGVHVFPADMA